MSTVMMASGAVVMMIIVRPIWVPLAVTALMASVGAWLWQRPEHPPGQPD
jgi:hypothetical protein